MSRWTHLGTEILDLLGGRRHRRKARNLWRQLPEQEAKRADWLAQKLGSEWKEQPGRLIAISERLIQQASRKEPALEGVYRVLCQASPFFGPGGRLFRRWTRPGEWVLSGIRVREIFDQLLQKADNRLLGHLARHTFQSQRNELGPEKRAKKQLLKSRKLRGHPQVQQALQDHGRAEWRRRAWLDQKLQEAGLWERERSQSLSDDSERARQLLTADRLARPERSGLISIERRLRRIRAWWMTLGDSTSPATLAGIWQGLRTSDPQFHTGWATGAQTGGWLSRQLGDRVARRLFEHPNLPDKVRRKMVQQSWQARKTEGPRQNMAPWTTLRDKSFREHRWRQHPAVRTVLAQSERPLVQERLRQDRRLETPGLAWAGPLSARQRRQLREQLPDLPARQQVAVVGELLLIPGQPARQTLKEAHELLDQDLLSPEALEVLYRSLQLGSPLWNPKNHQEVQDREQQREISRKIAQKLRHHPGLASRLAGQIVEDGWIAYNRWRRPDEHQDSFWKTFQEASSDTSFVQQHPDVLEVLLAQQREKIDTCLLENLTGTPLRQALQTILVQEERPWGKWLWKENRNQLHKRAPTQIIQQLLRSTDAEIRQAALLASQKISSDPTPHGTSDGRGVEPGQDRTEARTPQPGASSGRAHSQG